MKDNTIPGQMTIFDFIEDPYKEQKKNDNKIKEIEEREILRGSGFVNGKERIYKFFNEYHTEKEQVDFLKKEYGVGGWSTEEGFCNHDANGIDIEFDPPIGKINAIHNGWLMVARMIKRLVDSGLYKPDEPKCRIAEECEAYPRGCSGTIDPCRFGGPFKWSNKTEKLCGARCNGAEVIETPFYKNMIGSDFISHIVDTLLSNNLLEPFVNPLIEKLKDIKDIHIDGKKECHKAFKDTLFKLTKTQYFEYQDETFMLEILNDNPPFTETGLCIIRHCGEDNRYVLTNVLVVDIADEILDRMRKENKDVTV